MKTTSHPSPIFPFPYLRLLLTPDSHIRLDDTAQAKRPTSLPTHPNILQTPPNPDLCSSHIMTLFVVFVIILPLPSVTGSYSSSQMELMPHTIPPQHRNLLLSRHHDLRLLVSLCFFFLVTNLTMYLLPEICSRLKPLSLNGVLILCWDPFSSKSFFPIDRRFSYNLKYI